MRVAALASVVGGEVTVPLVGRGSTRYVNLDFAASAPALAEVADCVDAFLPWYSSVHRGAGYKSRIATSLYEEAREEVARFVGARPDDVVVFTRHTTDALNLLATTLPTGTRVLTFDTEHHANLLPWRRGDVRHLPMPNSPAEALDALEEALAGQPPGTAFVSVTGASNVTGELWPLADIVVLARRFGARVCVDAAQLAPHAPIDMAALDVDYLALSGHKLYAPYGAGALIGRADWLQAAEPWVAGGGAVRFVGVDDVAWADVPEKHEAGSPNVVGAVALAAACRALDRIGMEAVATHEGQLAAYAQARLAAVPGLEQYAMWVGEPRIGVVTCNLRGYHHNLLATVLSAEHGIGVRDGCFCAHPLMLRLLQVDAVQADCARRALLDGHVQAVPGAVRISTGVSTTTADVDAVCDALCDLVERGPRWSYRWIDEAGSWSPDPETRQFPSIHELCGSVAL